MERAKRKFLNSWHKNPESERKMTRYLRENLNDNLLAQKSRSPSKNGKLLAQNTHSLGSNDELLPQDLHDLNKNDEILSTNNARSYRK